jgi:hypothetical protein
MTHHLPLLELETVDTATLRARLRAELSPAQWADVDLAELSPAQWADVDLLEDRAVCANTADWVEEINVLVEGLALYFPGLAPAIRAVAHHLRPELTSYVCQDQCQHPWPLCGPLADRGYEARGAEE